jgi:hypothetical protein
MSDWKLITPEATINYVMNPSAELTGNFAAEAGTTVTRSTTYQHYGLYSYRVETNADNEGIEFTLSALTNAIHYVTMRVRGTLPAAWDWSLNGATFTAPTLLEQIDSNWALYGLQFPAAQANASVLLEVHQNGAGSGDFYLDGIQVEAKEYWTTYCDGTQEGCEWLGPENAATSQRSAASRAGGKVEDLEDDYNLKIGGMSGVGTAPQDLGVDKYAALPGGELNSLKIDSRVFTLTGVITGTSQSDFHSKKQVLLNALSPDTYPEDENGVQPVRLRYQGATIHKQIAAHYDGGLEGDIQASEPCAWERVAVRFFSPAPYWTEIGESAALLDTNDSATFRIVAARLRSTGQWSALGPPNAAGTYTIIRGIAEDATYVYFAGNFLNFDNIANADYIVRYNKQTATYSAMGTGTNGIITCIVIGPDGSVYIGGEFALAGGVANTVRIARWDGSAWNALSTGANNDVNSLTFGHDGTLYATGSFTTIGGVAANRIASWSGTAFSAMSTGLNDIGRGLTTGIDGAIYVTGDFSTAGGVTVNSIAKWASGAFTALGSGLNSQGFALTIAPNGLLFVTGAFTTAGGVSASRIAVWDGTGFIALGSGINNTGQALSYGNDGILYVSGAFTSSGGITLADRIARWNGYAWAHLDINLPGSATPQAILASKYVDSIVPQKYNLWLGFDTTGTGNFAGKITATNEGNAPAFPKIIYERSGGTTGIIETLKNETSGRELLFNYSLLSGERLTIDLTPTEKSIISNFFGPRPDAILANSDFGTWSLLPAANTISSFVATSGSPTITGWMLWKEQFKSQD